MGDSSKIPKIPESEDQILVTLEANIEKPEDHPDDQGDPPSHTEPTASEAMGVDANPADNLDLPSPILASGPVKATEETPPEKNDDDIAIIGVGHKAPERSNVLTKHTAKEETPLLEKGKSKLELPIYEGLSAEELHAGYLSCLATSRDMEASLVSMMKKKYEVHSIFSCYISLCSPKSLDHRKKLEYG